MQPHGFAAIAALGATLTGRPVRLRLNRTQDITMSGKRHGFHSEWRAGFDDDGHLVALDATLTADGGWSLDLSEPVLARAMCHIDNGVLDPERPRRRPDRQDEQDVPDRLPRLRWTAGHARRGGPARAGARHCSGTTRWSCGAAISTRQNQTTPYLQPVRHAERLEACWTESTGERRGRAPEGGDRGVQRDPPAHEAGAGDDAGEVRHLVQPHRVQPGRRSGPRLQGRLGPDQPRRHRDGSGSAHQDAAGGGDHARRTAGSCSAGPDPYRQGA